MCLQALSRGQLQAQGLISSRILRESDFRVGLSSKPFHISSLLMNHALRATRDSVNGDCHTVKGLLISKTPPTPQIGIKHATGISQTTTMIDPVRASELHGLENTMFHLPKMNALNNQA